MTTPYRCPKCGSSQLMLVAVGEIIYRVGGINAHGYIEVHHQSDEIELEYFQCDGCGHRWFKEDETLDYN